MSNAEFQDAVLKVLASIDEKLGILAKPRTVVKSAVQNLPKVSDADINEVYAAYPAKDVRNNNRVTGKGQKSKEIIRKRMLEGWTKEELIEAIQMYLDGNSYLPNFNSLLNNLPCKEEIEQPKVEQKEIWQ
jgi:hypothetical protein